MNSKSSVMQTISFTPDQTKYNHDVFLDYITNSMQKQERKLQHNSAIHFFLENKKCITFCVKHTGRFSTKIELQDQRVYIH